MSNISAIRADIYDILRGYGVADTLIEALRRIETCATEEEIIRINDLYDIKSPYAQLGFDVPALTPAEQREHAEYRLRDIFIRRFVRGMARADLVSLLNTILHNADPFAGVHDLSVDLFGGAVKAVSLTDLAYTWSSTHPDEEPIQFHPGDYPA